MSSQDQTTSVVTRGWMRRALWGGVILTVSLGIYVGTASRSVGQTGTSTADVCPTDQKSDTLQEFARKCFNAVGEDVPPFDCDAGTLVPETDFTGAYPNSSCDAPNVLNHECDPYSHFQVLKETNDVAIVAHCRKKSPGAKPPPAALPDATYGDIAVIQYKQEKWGDLLLSGTG